MNKLIVICVVILLLLGGCGEKIPDDAVEVAGGSVERYIDSELGVVCWIYDGHFAGGIDCMPLAETRLK